MAKMVVAHIPPWDGEYDLQSDRAFNAREWRWITQVSGYMPLTVSDGFAGGDPSLFVALTAIAMCRAGKIERSQGLEVCEQLSEAPFDGASISMVGDTVEADDVPLDLTSRPAEPSPDDSPSNSESNRGSASSSGPSSLTPSVPSDATPAPTTLLRLGTSSV